MDLTHIPASHSDDTCAEKDSAGRSRQADGPAVPGTEAGTALAATARGQGSPRQIGRQVR